MKGQEFGNYVVRDKIGEGGMGEVFLAEHRRMGRKAAIKVLRAPSCADAHDVERFFNEARAASIIDHPGVVQIFDCDFHDQRAYLIMEYIEGESLAALIQRAGSLAAAPESLRSIGTQIANVLAAAHAKGIVHRDLKPDNVFLESKPGGNVPFVVRILDFGIAKLVAADGPGLTKTGTVLGTPTYMAPEQCAGDRDVDIRADIYSLGCMLFEMAAGVPPFVRAGTGSLITAHMSEPAPSVHEMWPTAPAGFVALVAQMLAKEPAGRPQTMGEVESRLHQSLGMPDPGAAFSASPGVGPLLTTTVSLATEKQPVIETQIDPLGAAESPTAMLPARSLAPKVQRRYLPLLVVGVAATALATGLAIGLPATKRKTTLPVSSAATVMPAAMRAPAPSPPPARPAQPESAPREQSSPGPPPPEESAAYAPCPARTRARAAARRRSEARSQPKRVIRGFSDF